ncbi:MAG: hypothetical protein IPG17_35015 [Sandaracinaceae bacterium]|nr:hypothetical protein [Sandaracinaceae bacterium]
MDAIDPIEAELSGAGRLDVYHGANALWVCLVKLANLFPTSGEEHEQIAAMIRRFTRAQAAAILAEPGVDALIGLDPPLESVLAEKRERLGQSSATAELNRLRARRERDPKAAIAALFEILQRIRDKREHGFKTTKADHETMSYFAPSMRLFKGSAPPLSCYSEPMVTRCARKTGQPPAHVRRASHADMCVNPRSMQWTTVSAHRIGNPLHVNL